MAVLFFIMNHYLLYYSGTYYIIHKHANTPIEWILWSLSEKVATVKTKSIRQANNALKVIAFIDHLQRTGVIDWRAVQHPLRK